MLSLDSFALANSDSEYGNKILQDTEARRYTYGFNMNENFHGAIERSDFNGLELSFNQNKVKSKLLGQFNAYNLLSVWSACKLLVLTRKNPPDRMTPVIRAG